MPAPLVSQPLEEQARRIAQALHDEVGQLLTAAYISLSNACAEVPPAAQGQLAGVRQHLEAIEEQLRHLAHELRPRILDDIGLVPAIEFLADGVQKRRHVAVTVDATVERRLSALVETTVYRFVQEALNNAGRHAHASRIVIGVGNTRRLLRCTIQDDGVGFDPAMLAQPHHGLGLTGIRDRIDMLGGTLEIDSTPGHGTRLTIIIPFEG
jgi:signal transduction histidine kinase